MKLLGIVNIADDSFSDGGRFVTPAAALAHARRLAAEGADFIDLGAESSNPDGRDVPAEVEIERLTPLIEGLRLEGIRVSVDTHKPAVMRHALSLGAEIINDITGLSDPQSVSVVRDAKCRLIVMHNCSAGARAAPTERDPAAIVDDILHFFEQRIAQLVDAGIERSRLILDPGMGLFLGRQPDASVRVLRDLRRLVAMGLPVCVSTSRKSFIGAVLDGRPVGQRAAGTLASELWAWQAGVAYIRTHEPGPLRDAVRVWEAIEGCGRA